MTERGSFYIGMDHDRSVPKQFIEENLSKSDKEKNYNYNDILPMKKNTYVEYLKSPEKKNELFMQKLRTFLDKIENEKMQALMRKLSRN